MSDSRSVEHTMIGRHACMIAGEITGIIRFNFLGGIFLSLDEMNKRGKQNQLSEQVSGYMVEAIVKNQR